MLQVLGAATLPHFGPTRIPMSQPFAIQSATGCDPADEWVRLGVDLHTKGQLVEAAEKYLQALRIDPRHIGAMLNLAVAYAQQTPNRLNDAILTIDRAACILDMPVFGWSDEKLQTHINTQVSVQTAKCLILLEAGHINKAVVVGQWAATHAPKTAQGNHARYALALCYPTYGYPELTIPLYEEIIKYEPQHGGSQNLSFVETLIPLTTDQLIPSRKKWYENNRYSGEKKAHTPDSKAINQPLKVGYVTGDFKSHSASFIFSGVVLCHSSSVIPYFYSTLPVDPKADSQTKKFMDSAGDGRWRDIFGMNDEKAEALIRQDGIDILVDLTGHSGGCRLPLFSRKPAPVQMTGWGFAHGTGVPEIDYFLADPIVVPKDERQCFAEQVLDLPCVVTLDPPVWYNVRASSPSPFARNGHVTFGVFTRFEKLSDQCLETYRRILQAVPDSKIEFKDQAFFRPDSIRRVLEITGKGIDPERLLFLTGTNHIEHMRSYQRVDICLDPFPHCGGAVALEQLYMGVPLITLYGSQPCGRTAASLLSLMNRSSWIAGNVDEYVINATDLANNRNEMVDSRKTLRQELLNSPAISGYVKAVEKIYRDCWAKWCNSEKQA